MKIRGLSTRVIQLASTFCLLGSLILESSSRAEPGASEPPPTLKGLEERIKILEGRLTLVEKRAPTKGRVVQFAKVDIDLRTPDGQGNVRGEKVIQLDKSLQLSAGALLFVSAKGPHPAYKCAGSLDTQAKTIHFIIHDFDNIRHNVVVPVYYLIIDPD